MHSLFLAKENNLGYLCEKISIPDIIPKQHRCSIAQFTLSNSSEMCGKMQEEHDLCWHDG